MKLVTAISRLEQFFILAGPAGLQCPQLFQAYEQVVTGPCANTSLGETPLEALKAVVDMIEDVSDSRR